MYYDYVIISDKEQIKELQKNLEKEDERVKGVEAQVNQG